MSLLQKIKDASVASRKARDSVASSLLVTLYSEASNVGKNKGNRESTDQEVISVCKKFKDGLLEVIAVNISRGNLAALEQAKAEIKIVDQFIPQQISEDKLIVLITKLISDLGITSQKEFGKVMGHLKANFEGLYDGALASKIFKDLI